MTPKLNKALALTGMSLFVALTSGCKFTGGGSIDSASGVEGEKATLAMNGKCDVAEMTLNMQFNEHGTNLNQIRFHVDSTIDLSALNEECRTTPGLPLGRFYGEYCPQPYGQYKNDPDAGCGVVDIVVGDRGEGYYAPAIDIVRLSLHGGAFDGYYNRSLIQGNIQTH